MRAEAERLALIVEEASSEAEKGKEEEKAAKEGEEERRLMGPESTERVGAKGKRMEA